MLSAIIFDFDGTLANTFTLIYDAFRQVYREQGLPEPTDGQINRMFGPTEANSLRAAFTDHPEREAIVRRFLALYDANHADFVETPPGLNATLARLRGSGLALGVFTGKGRDTFAMSARHLFPDDPFTAAITGDDVARAKPDPEGLLKAIEQCGATPETALFVGDSDSDMIAGRAADVRTVRCDWLGHLPGFPRQEITAEATLTSLAAFEDYLMDAFDDEPALET